MEAFEIIAPLVIPPVVEGIKSMITSNRNPAPAASSPQHARRLTPVSLGKSRTGRRQGNGRGRNGVPRNFPLENAYEDWFGFSTNVAGSTNGGWIVVIDPTLIIGFTTRFQNTFAQWRLIAIDGMVSSDSLAAADGITVFSPFEADSAAPPSAPTSLFRVYEQPGYKIMSNDTANAKSVGIKFHWKTRDLESHLWSDTSQTTQTDTNVGIFGWTDSGSPWVMSVGGRMKLQFKDLRLL